MTHFDPRDYPIDPHNRAAQRQGCEYRVFFVDPSLVLLPSFAIVTVSLACIAK